MDTTVSKLAFLDEVICYYIQVVKQYSAFMGDSLLENWVGYRDLRKKKYLNNINNNLTKLAEIEKKKEFVIDKYKRNDKVSLSFYKNLYKELSNSASNSLSYMIKYYDKIRGKEDDVEKKEKGNNIKISYTLLEDGYYAHLRYENKKLVVNKTSFKNETIIFKSSLEEDHMKWDDGELSLSTYEKRRRKIIDKCFDIHKKIDSLKNVSIDSSYNLEMVYKICKLIIDDLYTELVSKGKDSDVFEKLMNMTKKQYGAFNCLTDYDVYYMEFNKSLDKLNYFVVEELKDISKNLKKTSKFIEFNIVDNTIPSVFDLYKVLNNRIINNVMLSVVDLKARLNTLTSYMTLEEVIRYYKRLTECKNNPRYSINCQKYFVKLIEERFNVPERIVLSDCMKEEKYY